MFETKEQRYKALQSIHMTIYFALKNLVLWAKSEAYGSAEIN